jgi:hypothetical protein
MVDVDAENTEAEQEERAQRESEEDNKRTAAFDDAEIKSEVNDITPEEKQAMMSKPVEYADSYVAPSGDVPYNPTEGTGA